MRRLLPFLALAALLAGCGSAPKTSSSGGSIPAGASVVRAGSLAFVSIDSDTSSDQWKQLGALAQKFPGRDNLVAQLKQKFTEQGVDYDTDVKPALGPELDLAVLSGGTHASTTAVALTKPDDPAKFKALVAKLNAKDSSGNRAVYREVDGWYALSDSQASISRALEGNAPLADDADFKEAMDKLPGDALAKVYVDGQGLNAIAQRSSGSSTQALGLDKLQYVAASASAEDDGVRIHGATRGGSFGGAEFASALIGGVPGDAFAFLNFDGQDTSAQLGKLKSNPQAAKAIATFEQEYGVPFEQVLTLLSGEVAFYARPGAGIPELTFALDPKDQSAALATLDKLAAMRQARRPGRARHAGRPRDQDRQPRPVRDPLRSRRRQGADHERRQRDRRLRPGRPPLGQRGLQGGPGRGRDARLERRRRLRRPEGRAAAARGLRRPLGPEPAELDDREPAAAALVPRLDEQFRRGANLRRVPRDQVA